MASTYSTLKLQLMTTGENTTTWGNVTNVNLGTAIEEAIVGSADVTFASTTVTLTLTDTNASQTARNLRLNLTGTSGGAQNLIVPAIEKVYIVKNGCADAITVKNSSGTGTAVPAGKTMWVYNDGTNVVDATTYLTSLTLGAALPVASGGTGLTSTPSNGFLDIGNGTGFTRAALTAGSGVSITNGAGTISIAATGSGGTVTSVGGTGTVNGISLSGTVTSSGNLTLGGTLSGVSLTSQVTGTLPVANGGTGGTSQATAQSALGVPSTTGSGASGTWGINISGNAATATSASSASTATTATTATNLSGGTVAATTITATGNITAYYSDDRLKTRLGYISGALAKVMSLRGFYYEANEVAQQLGYEPVREVGLSAQDVQAILPEVIAPAPIDPQYLTLDYARLVPLLVEAIKEQQILIDALSAKVNV